MWVVLSRLYGRKEMTQEKTGEIKDNATPQPRKPNQAIYVRLSRDKHGDTLLTLAGYGA